MTPGAVTAIALLVAELVAAGGSISALLREAQKSDRVSPERWASIMSEIRAAEDLWSRAPGPEG